MLVQALQWPFEARSERNVYYRLIGQKTEQWWTGEIWKSSNQLKVLFFLHTVACGVNITKVISGLNCHVERSISTCLSLLFERTRGSAKQRNEKCVDTTVSKIENRHAEKSEKALGPETQSLWSSNPYWSRACFRSSGSMSQNVPRFHGAAPRALDLTPLAASWVFCLLIFDPWDAGRKPESYLEIRGSLKFIPEGKRICDYLPVLLLKKIKLRPITNQCADSSPAR